MPAGQWLGTTLSETTQTPDNPGGAGDGDSLSGETFSRVVRAGAVLTTHVGLGCVTAAVRRLPA